MRQSTKTILVFLAMLFAGPVMLMAAGRNFQLELDCGTDYVFAGHAMTYVAGFKNHDFEQAYKVNFKSKLTGPDQWQMELGSDGLILGADQTVKLEQKLVLPRSINPGKYQILIKADNETMTTFDSCEFQVNR